MFKKATVLITFFLCWSMLLTPLVRAAPPTQENGQEYIVQAGDWLSRLAEKYYGDPLAYTVIVEATNARATEDTSFVAITDPDQLEVGQKLWLPATAATDAAVVEAAPTTATGTEVDLQQAYLRAVEDAAIAEPDEISKNLIPLVETNEALVWRGEEGNKQVLVVTWTNWEGYDDQVGQTITNTRQTWVTAVPELKDFCTTYNAASADLILRLEQLLGLPSDNGKTRFVEIWASPADLFRPSPDPEITDMEAELAFPTSKYLTIGADYMTWFDTQKGQSYGENGYPWTRLGYTYDWGNPNSEIGLSEFIIDTGASVDIQAVTLNEDYCR